MLTSRCQLGARSSVVSRCRRPRTSVDENSRKAYPLLLPFFLLRDSRTLVTLPNCEKYSAQAGARGSSGCIARRQGWAAAAGHPAAAGGASQGLRGAPTFELLLVKAVG